MLVGIVKYLLSSLNSEMSAHKRNKKSESSSSTSGELGASSDKEQSNLSKPMHNLIQASSTATTSNHESSIKEEHILGQSIQSENSSTIIAQRANNRFKKFAEAHFRAFEKNSSFVEKYLNPPKEVEPTESVIIKESEVKLVEPVVTSRAQPVFASNKQCQTIDCKRKAGSLCILG